MITLRSNQVEPIDKAIKFFRSDKVVPSLIVLPTAWGKSILTAYCAKYCDDKLIVLQPSKELLEQNYTKYVKLCGGMGFDAGIFSASFGRREIRPITYATIGSIKNMGAEFRRLGYTKMLIDEAHLYPRESTSMLGRFLRESGITHVLGITATPVKLQQNRAFDGGAMSKLVMLTSKSKKGNFFKEIIHVGQVQEMVNLNFWSKLQYERVDFDGSLLRYNTAKSEFTEDSVQQAYQANGGTDSVFQVINAHPERRHIIAYVPTVADAIDLARRYPKSGVVYGEQPKQERDATILAFKQGRIRVLFNVRVLSTGFDCTTIDCLILGISTASIALYYQIVGRGTRIDETKADCLICDMGGNYDRFGRVEDIVFQKGKIWRMFGTGGRLLSGIPIHEIGKYTIADTRAIDAAPVEHVMPFGKYKDTNIKDIPHSYRQWMLDNFQWTERNQQLRNAILSTMKQ